MRKSDVLVSKRKIFVSRAVDACSPFVWCNGDDIAHMEYYKITVLETGKSLYCLIYRATQNYVQNYNSEFGEGEDLPLKEPFITLSEHYRSKLGIEVDPPFSDYTFRFERCLFSRWYFIAWSYYMARASADSPDKGTICVAIIFAWIGVLIGIAGLIVSIISLCSTDHNFIKIESRSSIQINQGEMK